MLPPPATARHQATIRIYVAPTILPHLKGSLQFLNNQSLVFSFILLTKKLKKKPKILAESSLCYILNLYEASSYSITRLSNVTVPLLIVSFP